jgi:hypothetical protein
VRIEEKAQLQAQKKKEAREKEVLKALLVRTKTPAKPREALVIRKKVVSFISSDINGGGARNTIKTELPGACDKTTGNF